MIIAFLWSQFPIEWRLIAAFFKRYMYLIMSHMNEALIVFNIGEYNVLYKYFIAKVSECYYFCIVIHRLCSREIGDILAISSLLIKMCCMLAVQNFKGLNRSEFHKLLESYSTISLFAIKGGACLPPPPLHVRA